MTLRELGIGESAIILSVGGEGALRQHFLDMGVIPGAEVTVIKFAPMGDPVEIEYVLTFYEESVGDKGAVPQESAKVVLLIAGLIIIIGGILNQIVKKRKKQ